MAKFDSQIAVAELERAVIMLQHHIRQAKLHGDKETRVHFKERLVKLAEDARHAAKEK